MLAQDLRFAVRMLSSGGPVTLVAMLTLALGIGANTAIFSILNGVLLTPLPYDRPGELVVLGERHGQRPISVSWLDYTDWKDQNGVFSDMGATSGVFLNLVRPDAEPERLLGARVTASYFTSLGMEPLLGRIFTTQEDSPGGEPTILLSEGAWRRFFGGDPGIIGRGLALNGTSYTVIGVMPQRFVVQTPPLEAWISLGRVRDALGPRSNHPGISVVARLKPGVTIEQARAEMDRIAAQLARVYPESNTDTGVLIDPMHERIVGPELTRALLVLSGAVVFILLIACANVANLLLSRAAARQREIAVRSALGASRSRVLRQLLTESLLLAAAGGVAGAVIGWWGVRALIAVVPDNLARLDMVRMDASVFAFTAAVTTATGLVFGLAPALQVSKWNLAETLKEGGRGAAASGRANRVRSALVVSQLALSLVLLVGAGLMLRSFARLQASSPGVEPAGVVSGGVTLPGARYAEESARRRFYRGVIENLEATPGIAAAAAVMPLPLSGNGWQTSFHVEAHPEPEPGRFPTNDVARVTPGYFRTMGIRLLRGRAFTWDDDETAPLVAIIDETLAGTWFANVDPIGRRIKLNAGHPVPGQAPPPWLTIVGVVNHVKNYGIDQDSRAEVYVPFLQSPLTQLHLVVRGRTDAAHLAHAMKQAVREADATLPVFSIRTMDEYLVRTLAPKRLMMVVLALFAAIALTLAAVGIYGVMSYWVAQRTSEIGIRLALGARPADVLRLVLGHGLLLTVAGIAIGVAAAASLTRVMVTLLFGVSATDSATFGSVAVLLAVVAILATWIPARRAARVDPLVSLRCE